MYGLEKLTSMCGLGCKSFWHPWTQSEKLPYDVVNKDDDVTDANGIVTSEPQKPIWTELHTITPIVKNKSASVGNIRTAGYEKVASFSTEASKPPHTRVGDKRHSVSNAELNTSIVTKKALGNDSNSLRGSTASLDERLEITQLVSTV